MPNESKRPIVGDEIRDGSGEGVHSTGEKRNLVVLVGGVDQIVEIEFLGLNRCIRLPEFE